MILVTVGHQTPFDRLIRAADEWALERKRQDLFAQIGRGRYVPRHMAWVRFIAPEVFRQRMVEASAVVAHAGTGTIITALQLGKPVLVLPRLSALGETRNDHQIATARRFAQRGCVLAATDDRDLMTMLDRLEDFSPTGSIASQASPELLAMLRAFSFNGLRERPGAGRGCQLTPSQQARSMARRS